MNIGGGAAIIRFDDSHSNPIKKWEAMGSPEYLDDNQIKSLKEAAEVNSETFPGYVVNGNIATVKVEVPPYGAALVTFHGVTSW